MKQRGFFATLLILLPLLLPSPAHSSQLSETIISSADKSSLQTIPKLSRDIYYKTESVPSGPRAPRISTKKYPTYLGESRLVVWIAAQQHLYWGGFVLGALLLITILEIASLFTRHESSASRLDAWAQEILRLILLGLSITALLGGIFTFALILLYPDLTTYLFGVFRSSILIYGLLALGLTLSVYVYFYSWDRMQSSGLQWIHAALGIWVNVLGTTLMMTSNAWSSFMTSPAGIDERGHYLGNLWQAFHTALWNPTNVHRFASHLVLGAAVIAAYSAYQAWTTNNAEEKARYDWISTLSFFVMVLTLFTIPFGGYWLQREIYAYRQQMGITLLGGLLAWLGIVRVVIVGGLFLGINYYLWQRIDGVVHGKRYNRYAKYVFLILSFCFVVYITPHTIVMTPLELKQMGGQQHDVLGNYGVDSAKNAAVNIMIVVTMWSLIVWRKTFNHIPNQIFDWPLVGGFLVGAANIIWLGIYGYYIPANVRIGLSVPMVMTTLTLVIIGLWYSRRTDLDDMNEPAGWETVSTRGYFALFFLAFAVTWVIGLGGYLRSSVRLFWHVNEVIRDNSPWAFTHSSGFAANVITLNALIFWSSLLFLFWLAHLGHDKNPAFPQSNTQDLLEEKSPAWVRKPS